MINPQTKFKLILLAKMNDPELDISNLGVPDELDAALPTTSSAYISILLDGLNHIKDLDKAGKLKERAICGLLMDFVSSANKEVYSLIDSLPKELGRFSVSKKYSEIAIRTGIEISSSLRYIFSKWPKFSGSYSYPIPSMTEGVSSSGIFWNDDIPLWAGVYGDLRRELLDFLINWLNENNQSSFGKVY
ncbi:hypothetical protein TH2_134 [Shewanella phage Thanatos-2]|nr:hypothetical protein TH2_134 [Shewanella phage Thanatos-2]